MTGPARHIRLADVADAAWIATLHRELFEDAWSETAIAALLAATGALALVSETPGQPTGFLIAQTAADEAEILTVGVARDVQGLGIAGGLLANLLQRARAVGVAQIFLEVAEDNTPARALYTRHGFVEVGRRRGYYSHGGRRVDALLMRRSLSAAS